LFTVQAFEATVDTTQLLGVAFSPDGSRFATTSAGAATIWDAASGKKLLALPDQGQVVYSLAFSPDGRRIALGISLGSGATVWDTSSGRQLATLTGHHGSVQAILFSRDGQQILTGSVDGTVKLWDSASGRELLTLVRQNAQVNSMALSPDGTRLAVASSDGTLRTYLLSVTALQQLARSRLTRPLSAEECQKYLHAACAPATPNDP
jgi:WD40 repeat protein